MGQYKFLLCIYYKYIVRINNKSMVCINDKYILTLAFAQDHVGAGAGRLDDAGVPAKSRIG